MSNPQGSDANTPNLVQGSATQPVFGTGLDPSAAQNISWEVSDGTIDDTNTPDEPETPKEEVKESLAKEESQDVEEANAEAESDESTDGEVSKKKYKNRTPPAKRISELTREKKQFESLAQNLLREKEQLQNQLLQSQAEKAKTHYNLVKTNAERLQYDLAQAIEDGDSAEQARLHAQLSEYKAELRIIEREAHKQDYIPQQVQPEQHDYRPQEPHPYQEVEEKWLKTNQWANPESNNYDKEMHDTGFEYAQALTKQYKLEGRGDEIGTRDFFDEITGYIKDTYGMPEREPAKPKVKEPMQMTNGTSNVAPVNRPPVNSESIRSQNEIHLTPEQKETARAMKGILKDERGIRVYDNKACEKAYLLQLKRQMKGN